MKKNNNISLSTIFLITVLTFSIQAQEINYLTTFDYDNILIDDINWVEVHETKGDISKMKTLFGNSLNYKTESEPNSMIYFWNQGLSFRFENNSDSTNDYDLVSFRIKKYISNLSIKGKTITIGDHISKIGNVKTNNFDGVKTIIFGDEEKEYSAIFEIHLNSQDKINSIEYVVFD